MDDNMLYLVLGAIAIIAVMFFRRGQLLLALIAIIVGGWLYYNHDKGIDISETIYETIDEGAKSDYEQKFKSDVYDSDTNKVK